MRLGVLLVMLTGTSVAQGSPADVGTRRLCTHYGFARLPAAGGPLLATTIGVSIDHPLVGPLRVLGEYDDLSLGDDDTDGLPWSGHRLQAGARHRVVGIGDPELDLYVDADLGVGASVFEDRRMGVVGMVHAFGGLRLAFALLDKGTNNRFEVEIITRALVLPDGIGSSLAVGLVWGN